MALMKCNRNEMELIKRNRITCAPHAILSNLLARGDAILEEKRLPI